MAVITVKPQTIQNAHCLEYIRRVLVSMSESGQCLGRETQADSPFGRNPLFTVSRFVKKMTFGTGSTEK